MAALTIPACPAKSKRARHALSLPLPTLSNALLAPLVSTVTRQRPLPVPNAHLVTITPAPVAPPHAWLVLLASSIPLPAASPLQAVSAALLVLMGTQPAARLAPLAPKGFSALLTRLTLPFALVVRSMFARKASIALASTALA